MAAKQARDTSVSIVILNYKTDEMVKRLVSSIRLHPKWELIVVDNSPEPSLKPFLEGKAGISYVETGKNLGFSGGNNIGIRRAKGEWILILNTDVEITDREIDRLLKEAINTDYPAAAPVLLNKNKSFQASAGYLDRVRKPLNWVFARPRYLKKMPSVPTQVDFANGAVLLVHDEVFEKVGLFDEDNFFMYFEDIDFGKRMKRAAIPILYTPQVKVIHYGGGSSRHTTAQNEHYEKGLRKYLRKHRGWGIEYINRIIKLLK